MSSQAQVDTRLGYIDNLRSTMIVWVVAFHTAITYSHIGSWYYSDPKPADKVSSFVFLNYFIHPPIVVAVSQWLGWLPLPPLAKWLVVAPLAFLATLAVVHLVLRRTPLLRRII